MSDAKKTDDSKDGEEGAKPKPSKKKLFITIGAVVALLGGGGGAAWYFMGRGHQDEQADAAGSAKAAEKLKAARSFVTLDPFVVNLADTDLDRYTQIGVVLEVENAEANKKVSDRMPAIRNGLLLLISSKTASDLTSREGKEKLAVEIALSAGKDLGWTPPGPNAHGGGDGGGEQPDPKAKDTKPDDKPSKESDKKAKPAKPKPKAEPPPNPVTAVHFASFIVQ